MIRLLDLYQAREIPMICQQAQDFLDVAQWQHSLRLSPPPPWCWGCTWSARRWQRQLTSKP